MGLLLVNLGEESHFLYSTLFENHGLPCSKSMILVRVRPPGHALQELVT